MIFIDCCMLGVLFDVNARAAALGKCLTLREPSNCVRRLLELSKAEAALPWQ